MAFLYRVSLLVPVLPYLVVLRRRAGVLLLAAVVHGADVAGGPLCLLSLRSRV